VRALLESDQRSPPYAISKKSYVSVTDSMTFSSLSLSHSPATNFTGQAFVKGAGDVGDIDANDVKQGQLGDCNLLAPAAAIARANPEAIRKLISPNGDGSYNVTLYYKDHFWSDPTATLTDLPVASFRKYFHTWSRVAVK